MLFLVTHCGYYLRYSRDIDIDIDDCESWVVNLNIDDRFRVYHFTLPVGNFKASINLLSEFHDLKSAKHFLNCQYRLYTGSYRLIETGVYNDYHMPVAHRIAVNVPKDMNCEISLPHNLRKDGIHQYLVIASNDGLIPIHIRPEDLI